MRIALATIKIMVALGVVGLVIVAFGSILDSSIGLPESTITLLMSSIVTKFATVISIAYYVVRCRIAR